MKAKPAKAGGQAKLLEAIGRDDSKAVAAALRAEPGLVLGWQPIVQAAWCAALDSLDVLLGKGAPVDIVSANGHRHTPLVRAVEWKKTIPRTDGHRAVAARLLAAGADPHRRGGVHRWTPLAHAAMGDEADLVELLRPHGPDDLAHAAICLDAAAVARRLRTRGAAARQDDEGRTALHYLAASGLHRRLGSAAACAIAERLVAAGADPDTAQTNLVEEGWEATPLWWAVGWQDHAALARTLLELGARPGPALFAAAFDGTQEMLELLLAYGADLGQQVKGSPLLVDMLGFKRSRHLAFLLANGADPNAADRAGNTPLHAAARTGVRQQVIDLLLAAGANPKTRNAAGERAADIAAAAGRPWSR